MQLPKIHIGQKPTYTKLAEDINFYNLFEKIEQEFKTCFLFESLGEEGRLSRYSIIGFDPQHIIRAKENILYFDDKAFEVKNPYLALREIMPEKTISKNYAGGLIGYLSYESLHYFEPSLHVKVHPLFDQFMFGVYTDGLILDKITGELHYFYYDKNRIDAIRVILNSLDSGVARLPRMTKKVKVRFLRDTLTKKEHKKIVEEVKEQIRAGNTFQCEVGFKSEFAIQGDTLQIYKKLRNVNPSPYMYYLKFNDKKIIGASPELMFQLRDGEMESQPLAGTIQRGKNETEDKESARKLLSDPKEIAEHNMLVDLHRNDLGRVAEFGTVKVRNLKEIKRFSHVQHISSNIVGLIKPDEDMFSGLAVNFPMGTVSGTPKVETIKIIDNNEPEARGPYGGAVGQFGFNGDCTFALALRSLFIFGEYGYTQTSSGIVYDSEAEKEYAEVERKLAAMKEALSVSSRT